MTYLAEELAAGAPTPNSAAETRHKAAPVEISRERQPGRRGRAGGACMLPKCLVIPPVEITGTPCAGS
jgi:hypothetical protein